MEYLRSGRTVRRNPVNCAPLSIDAIEYQGLSVCHPSGGRIQPTGNESGEHVTIPVHYYELLSGDAAEHTGDSLAIGRNHRINVIPGRNIQFSFFSFPIHQIHISREAARRTWSVGQNSTFRCAELCNVGLLADAGLNLDWV